jgi:LysM repeat protein
MTTIGPGSSNVSRSTSTPSTSPSTSTSSSSESRPTPGDSYQIKSGDTLSAIAKEAYGDASQWPKIAEANPGLVTADGHIKAGDTINIPKAGADGMQSTAHQSNANKVVGNTGNGSNGSAGVPEGDPNLQGDLQNQLQQANQGGPTVKDKVGKGGAGKNYKVTSDVRSSSSKRTYSKGGGWMDEKKDVADEAQDKKKVSADWSANATIASRSATVKDSVWKAGDIDGEGVKLGDTNITAKGEVHALHAQATGSAAIGVDIKKGTIKGDVSGKVEAHLVGAEGKVSTGQYGNNVIHGQTDVSGKAFVGAEASGNVTVNIDPRKGDVKVGAGVDAFAGAKASATVKQTVGVAGHDVGSVGATGEVYAGVGVKAKAEAGFEDGKFKATVELGAALGVGAGVKLNVDVDVVGTAKAARDTAVAAYNGAKNLASSALDKAKSLLPW